MAGWSCDWKGCMSDPSQHTPPLTAARDIFAHIDNASLWLLFALAGGLGASLLAMGLLLRSDKRLTMRMVLGTVLHSLSWGVATFLMLVDQTSVSVPVMLSVSIISGMGLASFVDVLLLILRRQLGLVPPPSSSTDTPRQP